MGWALKIGHGGRRGLSWVAQLSPTWDLDAFIQKAFDPGHPAKLPLDGKHIPPACSKWFVNDGDGLALDPLFWSQFKDATCSLASLPEEVQNDVPTPEMVLKAGKGDVYESSLWLGDASSYTPLHRDPNPNLFMQLAGKKELRLLPPEAGHALFEAVQESLRQQGRLSAGSAAFRGEEMMTGPEADLLHEAVWHEAPGAGELMRAYGQRVEVSAGEALFIPKHCVQ
ncbi:hypothetical protein DV737_g4337, partial [Chaetothyriales sp. CBS 132003]